MLEMYQRHQRPLARLRRAIVIGFVMRWIEEGYPASHYEGKLIRWSWFFPPQ